MLKAQHKFIILSVLFVIVFFTGALTANAFTQIVNDVLPTLVVDSAVLNGAQTQLTVTVSGTLSANATNPPQCPTWDGNPLTEFDPGSDGWWNQVALQTSPTQNRLKVRSGPSGFVDDTVTLSIVPGAVGWNCERGNPDIGTLSTFSGSKVWTTEVANLANGDYTLTLEVLDTLTARTTADVNFSITNRAPIVNGSCGTAAKNYLAGDTSYTGSFCSAGSASPSNPAFPPQGGSTNWTCQGSGGGSDASCTATRDAAACTFDYALTASKTNPQVGETIKLTSTVSNVLNCSQKWRHRFDETNDGSWEYTSPAGTLKVRTWDVSYGSSGTKTAGSDVWNSDETLGDNDTIQITVSAPPPPGTKTLTTATDGTGSGNLTAPTGNENGINCGSGGINCTETYNDGTLVTITQLEDAGSTFTGWSGGCSGTGICTVTMSVARSVTATFDTSGGGGPTGELHTTSANPCVLVSGSTQCSITTERNVSNAGAASEVWVDGVSAPWGCNTGNGGPVLKTFWTANEGGDWLRFWDAENPDACDSGATPPISGTDTKFDDDFLYAIGEGTINVTSKNDSGVDFPSGWYITNPEDLTQDIDETGAGLTSKTYTSQRTGQWTITPDTQAGYTYSIAGCGNPCTKTLVHDGSISFDIVYTSTGGALSCSGLPANPSINTDVTFTGSGGSGAWSWSAPGGTPGTEGDINPFVTQYGTGGLKTVTVTRGFDNNQCTVDVQIPEALVVTPLFATVDIGGTQAYTACYDSDDSEGDGANCFVDLNVTASAVWTALNPSIADNISGDNIFTGVAAGIGAGIQATYNSISYTATLDVTEPPPPPPPDTSLPQCSDGIDNDGDGLIDDVSFNPTTPDLGCDSASDDNEQDLDIEEF